MPGRCPTNGALADAWLDSHRETLLWKCSGLAEEQLKLHTIKASELSLVGLVRHMVEVERDWFRIRYAGAQVGYVYCTPENMTAEFDVGSADAESDLRAYTCEIEAARRATRSRPLDETF